MPNKPTVIVDPYYRKMSEIFSPADRARLREWVEVVWGRDEPMPIEAAREASREIAAGDRAMREGQEKWLRAGNESTFLRYGQPELIGRYPGTVR